ncbi:MAG: hypothetical protein WC554_07400 [Clostridia bacterium]
MEEVKTHCVDCKFEPPECGGRRTLDGECMYFEPKERPKAENPEFETTIRAV